MEHEEAAQLSKGDALLQQMLEQYQGIVDQISESDFMPIFHILKTENIKIEQGDFIKRCTKDLYESISEEFKESWQIIGIGDSISILEKSKANASLDAVRPPSKTPKDQVQYQYQEQLRKKRDFYEKQLQFQKLKLERVIGDVLEMRNVLSTINSKRSEHLQKISEDETKMKEMDSYLDEIDLESSD